MSMKRPKVPQDETEEQREIARAFCLVEMAVCHIIGANDRYSEDMEEGRTLNAYSESELALRWTQEYRALRAEQNERRA